MKYLLIILLLGLIASLLLYFRLRPYLPFVRQLFSVFRLLRTGQPPLAGGLNNATLPRTPAREKQAASRLVACAVCETWTPENRSLALGPQRFCSRECLEKAAARK